MTGDAALLVKGYFFVIEFAGGSLTSVGSCTSFVHSPPSEGSHGSLAKKSAFKWQWHGQCAPHLRKGVVCHERALFFGRVYGTGLNCLFLRLTRKKNPPLSGRGTGSARRSGSATGSARRTCVKGQCATNGLCFWACLMAQV